MDKLIVFKLDGNCEEGFRCTLKIWKNNQFPYTDFTESKKLPPNPQIAAFEEEHWRHKYRVWGAPSRHTPQKLVHLIYPFLHANAKTNIAVKSAANGLSFRIKPGRINATRNPVHDCKESGRKLAQMLNDWLKSPEFAKVEAEQFQPLAIGLNMHRNLAREPGRNKLITHFDSHPNLITICSYGYDKNYDPPPEFSQEKLTSQVGFSNLQKDEAPNQKGSSIRLQPLSYQPHLSSFTNNCKISNSLSLLLALRFLESQGIKSATTQNQEWLIGNVTFPRLAARTGGYQNLDPRVSQVLLNYRANPKPALKVTLQEVLSGKINSDLVKGKIVLIGHTSEVSR